MTNPQDARRPEILVEGGTCWRVRRAQRAAFLVDGEHYFAALADALEAAQRRVWLVGWDFHSALRLRRDERGGQGGQRRRSDRPADLASLLDALVRERRELEVHVLAWDFTMLYALDREFLPLLQFGARTHRRVHFAMDAAHALGASQHQKLVVIDDAIAFVGGLDLTAERWDTRAHRADEPGRVDPGGGRYAPFHDVQVAFDGEAARAMGALARDRWRRATGQELPAVEPGLDAWPATLDADIANVRIGIARTRAAYAGDEEVREIEALYAEMIAGAERWIYVENQYLTSVRVVEWLRRRLDEQGGPEVVVVGPRENAGWLEQQTMGVLRRRAVERLRASAGADRLRILYPDEAGLPPSEMIHVHSKLMVVDDDWLRIGSANLANRSMGVDTECDVVIDAEGREEVRRAIGDFRDDLLAEHLGVDVADVSETLARSGSLVATIDALADEKGRTLRHLDVGRSEEGPEAVELVRLADPEHPAPLEELVRRFESEQAGSSSVDGERRRWGMRAMGLGAAAAALILWQWAEIAPWLDARRWAELLLSLRGEQRAPLVGLLVFVVASLLFVPLSALSVAAGVAFGPVTGAGVAWAGSVGSAALGYGAGRVLWRDTVRRLAGRRLNRLSRRLGRQGFLSSLLLALLPVAPYTLANLVAGASHVRARDFLLGTLVGVLPWSVAMALFGDFAARIAESGWEGMAELSAVAAGAILLGGLLRLVARSAARGADRAARGSSDPGA